MPWKPLALLDREARATSRQRERRARFLVDENVDAVVAELLVSFHFNTVAVARSEFEGAADDVVFQRARKERRILLTYDEDFLDDRRFPLALSPGIIVMRRPHDTDTLASLMRLIVDVFGPYGELWEKQKIVLSPSGEVVNRVREFTGRVTETRYRLLSSRGPEEWVDEG